MSGLSTRVVQKVSTLIEKNTNPVVNSAVRYFNFWKENGTKKFLYNYYMYSDAKVGRLVGTDANGVKYFENIDDVLGKTRWMENPKGYKFDVTTISPEWHAWAHYVNDIPGHKVLQGYSSKWVVPREINQTGTSKAYSPPGYILNKAYKKPQTNFEEWTPKPPTN
eukprot:TRINITY_DN15436_c0_g1_i1.p1 TRINITY_DN15436_c0_g1~~TRINITY_DN15436_c0_g1_i1.p1  ORF type:complete len:165 (-),score=19.23 TRINITY_DN15436_c0_g1_i1:54-548(-)